MCKPRISFLPLANASSMMLLLLIPCIFNAQTPILRYNTLLIRSHLIYLALFLTTIQHSSME